MTDPVTDLRKKIDEAVARNEQIASALADALGLTPTAMKDIRSWRENSRSRLRKGLAPRRFASENIPAPLATVIWKRLEHAKDRESVDAAFTFGGTS